MARNARQRPTKPTRKGKAKVKHRDVASPEILYDRAQDALTREDYDSALSMLKSAAELDPHNAEINDAYGSLLAECGRAEEAVSVLRQSVVISPDAGHEKYLYLGQLLAGQEAVNAVSKGVEILERQLTHMTGDAEWEADAVAGELSRALCSQAELVLSNSAEVDAVCLEVESLLARASDIDCTNPEPAQVLCSLRVEQGRPEEALAMLRKSMGLWFTSAADRKNAKTGKSEDAGTAGENEPEDCSTDDDVDMLEEEESIPSYEFRIETAKLLLELDETTDQALEIIVRLLSENDNVPDTWHLYGMCLHASGQFDEALKAVEDGRMVCRKMGMPEDDIVMQSFTELQESVKECMSGNT